MREGYGSVRRGKDETMDLADGSKIEVFFKGALEQRGDHFAAYIKGLGITGYGPTVEDARDRAKFMAQLMLGDLEKAHGTEAVFDRLSRAEEIEWRPVDQGNWSSSFIHEKSAVA
jgi:hypothetical protein